MLFFGSYESIEIACFGNPRTALIDTPQPKGMRISGSLGVPNKRTNRQVQITLPEAFACTDCPTALRLCRKDKQEIKQGG